MEYILNFPPLVEIHDVFHVSLIKSYIWDVDHVID